jgi:serine/threonine-protein kinase RsbW
MASVARAAVRALLESADDVRLEGREIDEVAAVVQEACTNAVRHAHGMDATKRVRVEVRRGEEELEILVMDEGAPFDLAGAEPLRPELLREGGYGIHIMRAWMDDVSVTNDGRGNVVRLVRRYGRAASPKGGALAGRG